MQSVAFAVCGVQTVVLAAFVLYKTEPAVGVYTTRLQMVNGTPDVQLFTQEYGASPFALLASVLILLFAAVTHQLNELEQLDNVIEYCEDSIAQAGMWNGVMWLMFTAVHVTAILCIAAPIDVFLLLLTVCAVLYSVACVCHPGMRNHGAFLVVLYLGVMLAIFNNMPQQHGTRIVAFVIMLANDLLLVTGHTYDIRPTMMTVGNCRLAHAAFSSLLILTVYGI